MLGPRRSYLWWVTADRIEVHFLPAREGLEELVDTAYRLLPIRLLRAAIDQALTSHGAADLLLTRVSDLRLQLVSVVPEENTLTAVVGADARVEVEVAALPG